MAIPGDVSPEILSTLKDLRSEVSQLSQRVAALEAGQQPANEQALVLAISAAVAAYLGVTPKIRQIRLISNPQWVAHGRATIQGSHKLALGRSPQ